MFESTNVKYWAVAAAEAVVLIKEDVNAFEDVPNKDPVKPAEAVIEDADILEADSTVAISVPPLIAGWKLNPEFVNNFSEAAVALFVSTNVKKCAAVEVVLLTVLADKAEVAVAARVEFAAWEAVPNKDPVNLKASIELFRGLIFGPFASLSKLNGCVPAVLELANIIGKREADKLLFVIVNF